MEVDLDVCLSFKVVMFDELYGVSVCMEVASRLFCCLEMTDKVGLLSFEVTSLLVLFCKRACLEMTGVVFEVGLFHELSGLNVCFEVTSFFVLSCNHAWT